MQILIGIARSSAGRLAGTARPADSASEGRRFAGVMELVACLEQLCAPAPHPSEPSGGQRLVDALAAPSQLVPLTGHQGADGHCGGLGQEIWSEVVYHWLRNTLLPDPRVLPAGGR